MDEPASTPRYAGFWLRVGAALIDSIALLILIWPLLYLYYGPAYFDPEAHVAGYFELLLNWLVPAVFVIVLWIRYQATPGKMLLGARVVDATSGGPASSTQYVLRYLGYYLAGLPLGVGLLWVAFDRRKQGWHDKLARTVVIRV